MTPIKTWGLRGGLVLAGVLAGGLAQRYLGTPRVEVRTETRDVVHEVVKEVVKVEVREVAAKAETRVVYRSKVTTPDGACRETTVERTDSAEASGRVAAGELTTDTQRDTLRETSTTTTPLLPRWRVGVSAGASLAPPLLPLAGQLVLGAEVDYRLAGQLWVGGRASTQGSVGAVLSLSF